MKNSNMNLLTNLLYKNRKLPTTEESLANILRELEPFKKVAYIPQTKIKEAGFSTISKFGGLPYLRHKNDWPVCSNCNQPMHFFLQLNLNDTPTFQENAMIQLFYCTNCETEIDAFFPYSKGVVCRKINIEGKPISVETNLDHIFEEKIINSWKKAFDYPHFEEYDEIGLNLDIDENILELMEDKGLGIPLEGEKLFGWPYWVQSVEYPNSRIDQSRMELLFQLDSQKNLPFMFGDSGIAHLTYNKKHLKEMAFGWSSY